VDHEFPPIPAHARRRRGTGGGSTSGEFADVVFEVEGGGGDEALAALLAAEPVSDPSKFAMFTEPTEGQAYDAGTPPTFVWEVVQVDSAAVSPARPDWSPFAPVLELVGGIREAHAHGIPVNGNAYLLLFGTPDDEELLRVFTDKTSYTPDAETWAKLAGADAPLNAWILMGVFDNDRIASDGGPFEGPWVAFSVE
jgi:hypothetical protein